MTNMKLSDRIKTCNLEELDSEQLHKLYVETYGKLICDSRTSCFGCEFVDDDGYFVECKMIS